MKKRIFVVSCQALKGEPLYGSSTMLKMANASIIGGCDWIRTSQIENIKLLKDNLDVPIIGIIKKNYKNSLVRITPTLRELKLLVDSGVEIIAMDATLRKRPKEDLEKLTNWFLNNKKNYQKLMADCSNIKDIKNAIDNKAFDFIGTTLIGFTIETKGMSLKDDDFEIIKKIKNLTNKSIVAEGQINTPQEAKRAFEVGANIVVMGSAITRPRTIVKRIVDEIRKE